MKKTTEQELITLITLIYNVFPKIIVFNELDKTLTKFLKKESKFFMRRNKIIIKTLPQGYNYINFTSLQKHIQLQILNELKTKYNKILKLKTFI